MAMKMAGTRGIGVASLLFALLLTYGCAPKLIKMEKAELARLHDEGEIQAVHYSSPSPEVNWGDPDTMSPVVSPVLILMLPFYLWDSHQKSKQVEQLSLEDPVVRVKERVVRVLETAFDLKSVRLVQEPLVGDDLVARGL